MLHDQTYTTHKIQAGDRQAFEEVFKKNYAGMCGYANKYLKDLDEAEEIVQDVFYNFWQKRTSLSITGSLGAYLFRAVRNACINQLKYQKVRANYAVAHAQSLQEEEVRSHDQLEELELQHKIDDCISQLPSERQKIFKLSRFENMKYQEIANHLNISVKTVEGQMGKALKFLRENLAEYLPVWMVLIYIYSIWSLF